MNTRYSIINMQILTVAMLANRKYQGIGEAYKFLAGPQGYEIR